MIHFDTFFINFFWRFTLDCYICFVTFDENKHIERLKKEIEKTYGAPVRSRGDCEKISTEILNKTSKYISYNTLRRFFGLAGKQNNVKPSLNTLNILANYCGYPGYFNLSIGEDKQNIPVEEVYSALLLFEKKQAIDYDAVAGILKKYTEDKILYFFVYELIQLALKLDDISFLKQLFNLPVIFNDKTFFYTPLFFSILSLGINLRSKKYKYTLWNVWCKNKNAQSFYFELFVDMDELIISHHKAIALYQKHKQTPEANLFAGALLAFKHFISGKFNLFKKEAEKLNNITITKAIHPIPIARMLTVNLLYDHSFNNGLSKATKEKIHFYLNTINKHGDHGKNTIYFHVWLLEGLILSKEYDIAEKVIQAAEKRNKKNKYFHNNDIAPRYFTYKGFVHFHLGNKSFAEKTVKNIVPTDFHPFSLHYDSIFLNVLLYKLYQKKEYLENAKKTAKQYKYNKLMKLLIAD